MHRSSRRCSGLRPHRRRRCSRSRRRKRSEPPGSCRFQRHRYPLWGRQPPCGHRRRQPGPHRRSLRRKAAARGRHPRRRPVQQSHNRCQLSRRRRLRPCRRQQPQPPQPRSRCSAAPGERCRLHHHRDRPAAHCRPQPRTRRHNPYGWGPTGRFPRRTVRLPAPRSAQRRRTPGPESACNPPRRSRCSLLRRRRP